MSVIFDIEHRQLINGESITDLSRQQTECLSLLVSAEGNIVTREEIMKRCWTDKGLIVSDSSMRVALYQLRKQLAAAGVSDTALVTEVGSGYRLRNGYLALAATEPTSPTGIEITSTDEASFSRPVIPSSSENKSRLSRITELPLFILSMISLALLAGWIHMTTLYQPIDYITLYDREDLHILVQKGMRADAADIQQRYLFAAKTAPYRFSRPWIYVNRSILQHGNLSALVCDRDITQSEKLCYSLNFMEKA